MRYIDLVNLEFPPGWSDRANKALTHLKKLPQASRASAINSRSAIWAVMKPKLKKLSFKKCWYCESKEVRADQAVDHYRPKGAVKECPKHNGYWWLAFDWRNFRYSCQFCNELRTDQATGTSGGKATYFPLFNESKRVFSPGSISRERPKLLDPTVKADTLLLTFDATGMARPRDKNKRTRSYQRAKVSIERYNLNHSDLQELRRAVFAKIERKVNDGDVYYSELSAGSRAAKHGFSRVVEDLSEMVSARAKYSMTAHAALRVYKNRSWIKAIISSS